MARTDPLTTAALTLLNGHGHHHHHHKVAPTPTPTQTFHIGSFHHYISGNAIGYGLGVIIVIAIIVGFVAILRS